MTLLGRLLGAERRDYSGPWEPYADGRIPPPSYFGGGSSAGVQVNDRTALGTIDVYACVSLLADDIAQLPLDAFRRTPEFREEIDPQPPLIAQPDPEIEQWEWISRVVTSLVLRGNAYALLGERDTRGFPRVAMLVHPDDIEPRRNRDTLQIEYRLRDGQILPKSDVLHIPLITVPGALKGLSPIDCAARGIGSAIATEEFGARWFGDGATPSSVLEADTKIDDEQARRIQAKWVASQGGRRRPAVLGEGLKWRPITITPNESQFLETRQFNTLEIARLFRIPPHKIGETTKNTSWGSGLEETNRAYAFHTLGAYTKRIEAALSSKKVSPADQYVKFNYGALLRGRLTERFAAYAVGRQWGWYSANDVRRFEDEPPIPNGDDYLVPLNMAPTDVASALITEGLNGNNSGNPDSGTS